MNHTIKMISEGYPKNSLINTYFIENPNKEDDTLSIGTHTSIDIDTSTDSDIISTDSEIEKYIYEVVEEDELHRMQDADYFMTD